MRLVCYVQETLERCRAAEGLAEQRAHGQLSAVSAGNHAMMANPLFGEDGSPAKTPSREGTPAAAGAADMAAAAAEVATLREQLAAALKERDTARQQFAR